MRPSRNTIETVKIIWDSAKADGYSDWTAAYNKLAGIGIFLCGCEPSVDYLYVKDMQSEVLDMMFDREANTTKDTTQGHGDSVSNYIMQRYPNVI